MLLPPFESDDGTEIDKTVLVFSLTFELLPDLISLTCSHYEGSLAWMQCTSRKAHKCVLCGEQQEKGANVWTLLTRKKRLRDWRLCEGCGDALRLQTG